VRPLLQRRAISITQPERVLAALGIEHTVRLSLILLSSVVCPAVQYISTLSHKRHDFRKIKVIEYKMCSDFLYKFCVKHVSSYEELSQILSTMSIGLQVKYPLF
jgi:hypothetical protein